jgi:hypothetical protein
MEASTVTIRKAVAGGRELDWVGPQVSPGQDRIEVAYLRERGLLLHYTKNPGIVVPVPLGAWLAFKRAVRHGVFDKLVGQGSRTGFTGSAPGGRGVGDQATRDRLITTIEAAVEEAISAEANGPEYAFFVLDALDKAGYDVVSAAAPSAAPDPRPDLPRTGGGAYLSEPSTPSADPRHGPEREDT